MGCMISAVGRLVGCAAGVSGSGVGVALPAVGWDKFPPPPIARVTVGVDVREDMLVGLAVAVDVYEDMLVGVAVAVAL